MDSSCSSDKSDESPPQKRKHKTVPNISSNDIENASLNNNSDDEDGATNDISSCSDSGSPIIGRKTVRSRRKKFNVESGSDTDESSDSFVEVIKRVKRKAVQRLESNSESESSGSDVIHRPKKAPRIVDESSSYDSSDWETDNSNAESNKNNKATNEIDSDSSDGQSEKCPICLISFRGQEIGTPESCDHMFCLQCLQEWSKTMNTCPVDRQEYDLILVRKDLNGKVIKQLIIEKPQPQNESISVIDDLTFCEVCGSEANEDRMLLCDGCDLGYHLYCLTPPLTEIPTGLWYCSDCSPMSDGTQNQSEDEESWFSVSGRRNRSTATNRLVPRTRQSERVRTRIRNIRQNRSINEPTTSSLSSTNTSQNVEATVSSTTASSSNPRPRKKPTKKRKKRIRRIKYKIVYEIDEATGETVIVKKRKRRYRRKKKTVRAAANSRPKTVKKRLAAQLGICKPRNVPQNLPDVKIPNTGSNQIVALRHGAGIPELHLFGFDYFSNDEEEDVDYADGLGIINRRAPNHSDVALFQRQARRKMISLPQPAVSSSTDILGSILDTQEQFHSRNTVFSVDSSGKLKMEKKNNNNSYIDLNKCKAKAKKAPNYNEGQHSSPWMMMGASTTNGQSSANTSTPSSTSMSNNHNVSNNGFSDNSNQEVAVDYSQRAWENVPTTEKDKDEESGSNDDLYSDIETVSTSKDEKDEENDAKDNPEGGEENKEPVVSSSTIDNNAEEKETESGVSSSKDTDEIQSETIQSTNEAFNTKNDDNDNSEDDEDDSEDGCPNFSIYSKESINLAKNTDITLEPENSLEKNEDLQQSEPEDANTLTEPSVPNLGENLPTEAKNEPEIKEFESEIDASEPEVKACESETKTQSDSQETKKKDREPNLSGGLYSDSEDESIVKKVDTNFAISDIRNMTEDILSEEERSYTPCLDEKAPEYREGLDGLDTEMISDEERNDFDESHELKTASDGGDALEINAKESELDFTRPEDCEEGEIVDKSKKNKKEEPEVNPEEPKKVEDKKSKTKNKDKDKADDNSNNKENEDKNKELSFKKLSKSNRERNYRDRENKDKERSKSPDRKTSKGSKKERKEKRKELERYDVKKVIAERPRRDKDKFGRDIPPRKSDRSSLSLTPPPRNNRSLSRDKVKKRRGRSRSRGRKFSISRSRSSRRSRSRSRSRSPILRKRSRSKTKKKRSRSRSAGKRKSRDRGKNKKKPRSRSRRRSLRSRSASPPHRKRDYRRSWSPSISRSRSPERFTPSWTPPRVMDNAQGSKQRNLTVILNNDAARKRKEKKKKEKRNKSSEAGRRKRRHADRTPPPSKEIFASGDNILVSVSFNKENETRDVTTRGKRRNKEVSSSKEYTPPPPAKKTKKDKKKERKRKEIITAKPVAIIDLERSPFKELTPSPKDIIVLSDSDNNESNDVQKSICDSSQQVESPRNAYAMGPKTPPEPQVKFSLPAKQPVMRAITNPLHEPDELDMATDENADENSSSRHAEYKGPNTPPEPPNSPPSSPDAYDPFEPTKSRSPTPELQDTIQNGGNADDNISSKEMEINRNEDSIQAERNSSSTPPIADIQPADSQSSIHATPEPNLTKSPTAAQIMTVAKPIAQTTPFSSSISTSIITSTPAPATSSQSRINILNSTLITPSSISQRIVLPNVPKSSPVKITPTKQTAIKSTPIKPMPTKSNSGNKNNVNRNKRNQNGGNDSSGNLDFDSPYSPGSSDYEDLFEPPSETPVSKPNTAPKKPPPKLQNTFDALFGSPIFNKNKPKDKPAPKFGAAAKKQTPTKGGTKQVGVKLDEDHLKILDDLPSSAVEMQVKDKFLKKLNRQERVVEEVKLVLKPHYNKKRINKEEYKDILRRAVPKICHNKSGEINPTKIKNLIEAYVKKIRHSKKVTSSSSVNTQKV